MLTMSIEVDESAYFPQLLLVLGRSSTLSPRTHPGEFTPLMASGLNPDPYDPRSSVSFDDEYSNSNFDTSADALDSISRFPGEGFEPPLESSRSQPNPVLTTDSMSTEDLADGNANFPCPVAGCSKVYRYQYYFK